MENKEIKTDKNVATSDAKVSPKAKTPVKKIEAPKTATPAKAVVAKPSTKQAPKESVKVTKVEAIVEKVVAKVEETVVNKVEVKVEKAKSRSTISKVIEAGKATNKIAQIAGMQILGTSIETTKAIADIYKKAGKKAVYLAKELLDDTSKLGKELMNDTSKIVAKNQKNVKETSMKAFKQTVDTIKDSNIIENPLKGILKNKKK